jgi:hypothetical protein
LPFCLVVALVVWVSTRVSATVLPKGLKEGRRRRDDNAPYDDRSLTGWSSAHRSILMVFACRPSPVSQTLNFETVTTTPDEACEGGSSNPSS